MLSPLSSVLISLYLFRNKEVFFKGKKLLGFRLNYLNWLRSNNGKKNTERSSGHDMEKNNRYRITNDRSEWGQKIMNKYHYKWEQEQIHMGRMSRSNLCCLFLPINLKNVYANWNLSIFTYMFVEEWSTLLVMLIQSRRQKF